ncbi:hypothetical protein DF182_22505 [Chitinophaga flava]|uniref:Uncharacterized protein n=1 Tax=Chitinophaga flava TaxID=2259036 RepID=A0A365XSE7_9BACT|nr:hypothetical protein DF182_22505 [Chitinophaga flava]
MSKQEKDSLISLLFQADTEDQRYRSGMQEVQSKYGGDSPEMKTLLRKMTVADSINLIKISSILDHYGWLGPAAIGSQGNATLFMVIQHSDIKAQEKYLPMMRDAVQKGNAKARSLALLEDRVALHHGQRQLYGSQVIWNMKTNKYQLAPLEDPDNVDTRRLTAGLPPLKEYLSVFGLEWNVEQFKKEAAANEADFFKRTPGTPH